MKISVEEQYTRAAPGGVVFFKKCRELWRKYAGSQFS